MLFISQKTNGACNNQFHFERNDAISALFNDEQERKKVCELCLIRERRQKRGANWTSISTFRVRLSRWLWAKRNRKNRQTDGKLYPDGRRAKKRVGRRFPQKAKKGTLNPEVAIEPKNLLWAREKKRKKSWNFSWTNENWGSYKTDRPTAIMTMWWWNRWNFSSHLLGLYLSVKTALRV